MSEFYVYAAQQPACPRCGRVNPVPTAGLDRSYRKCTTCGRAFRLTRVVAWSSDTVDDLGNELHDRWEEPA